MLSPMLGGNLADATAAGVSQSQFISAMSSMPPDNPTTPTTMSAMVGSQHHFSTPPTVTSPSQQQQQQQPLPDPSTLTKEINVPMPNLGQPHLSMMTPATSGMPPAAVMKPFTNATKPLNSFSEWEGAGLVPPTSKAVVKPQILTHVIDGHIIKESSQPFPVSQVKGTVRFTRTYLLVGNSGQYRYILLLIFEYTVLDL
jgi:hypothetical protein